MVSGELGAQPHQRGKTTKKKKKNTTQIKKFACVTEKAKLGGRIGAGGEEQLVISEKKKLRRGGIGKKADSQEIVSR